MEQDAAPLPGWELADFRRPNKLTRDQVRSLDVLHDTFTRRLSAVIGAAIRAGATAEIGRTSQMTWEDFVRTLPSHTVLATIGVDPLPGEVLVEMDTSVALALVDRLLGGKGTLGAPRRPTDLETPPLRRVAQMAADAFGEAIGQFVAVDAHLTGVDYSPQLVALTAPSSMVLVLSYAVNVPSAQIAGDLTVVLPLTTLAPALDKLAAHVAERTPDATTAKMNDIVSALPVTVEARLATTYVPAVTIAGLTPGDVIVLDHQIGRPASVCIDGDEVFTGHIGRRGPRFAVEVDDHPFADPAAAATAAIDPRIAARFADLRSSNEVEADAEDQSADTEAGGETFDISDAHTDPSASPTTDPSAFAADTTFPGAD